MRYCIFRYAGYCKNKNKTTVVLYCIFRLCGVNTKHVPFSLSDCLSYLLALHLIMHLSDYLYLLILALTAPITTARKSPESVLLSNVKTLTLRKDLKTAHNRVPAVPQLTCIGGTAQGIYEIDVLRCKNSGSAYGDEDVQWTCTASLPPEFKLGSTDVVCEGFSSSQDPYVLKGSCGAEYRLMLTEVGEEKYGKKGKDMWDGYQGRNKGGDWAAVLFWFLFLAVLGWMVYAAFLRDGRGVYRLPGAGNNPYPWGGGGYGGGGGDDDPPPPYDHHPSSQPKATSSRASRAPPAQAQGGWRPGFWTGALGGAAAGYMAGNRGQNQPPRNTSSWDFTGRNNNDRRTPNLAGLGADRTRLAGSSSSNSDFGSSRHESSGFGGTSRR